MGSLSPLDRRGWGGRDGGDGGDLRERASGIGYHLKLHRSDLTWTVSFSGKRWLVGRSVDLVARLLLGELPAVGSLPLPAAEGWVLTSNIPASYLAFVIMRYLGKIKRGLLLKSRRGVIDLGNGRVLLVLQYNHLHNFVHDNSLEFLWGCLEIKPPSIMFV